MAIRLILIDDEPAATLGIRALLSRHKDFEVVEEASSAQEAIEKIRRLHPDAIFLDVRMLSSSGLEVARTLELTRRPLIVFLTAYRQYALQAFDVAAADYLLKPVDGARFEMTLDRIRESVLLRRAANINVSASPDPLAPTNSEGNVSATRLAIPDGKMTRLIEMIDIDWIGVAGDHSKLHVGSAIHVIREPLSFLLQRLSPGMFHQIHRSAVVNLTKVSDFMTLHNQDLVITLKDGTILRASRTFSDVLKRALTRR